MEFRRSFLVSIQVGGRPFFEIDLVDEALPKQVERPQSIYAGHVFKIAIKRKEDLGFLRIRLGNEIVWEGEAQSGYEETEAKAWLRNDIGQSKILLEILADDETFQPILTVPLQIKPRPDVEQDFFAMFEDVLSFHEGLVQDVVGRAWVNQDLLKDQLSRLQPLTLVTYLKKLYEQINEGLLIIARQPSTQLTRVHKVIRYRGGEPLDATAIASLTRSSEIQIDRRGRLTQVGRIRVRKHTLTEDLVEHRHIASEVLRLARKAFELANHCQERAALLEKEESVWGRERQGKSSVFEAYYTPRIESYRTLDEEARLISRRFRELTTRFSFIKGLPSPLTPFGPTPIFLGRPAYRKIYRLLLQTRKHFGILLDQDAMWLQYRDFPTLYEVWCLVQVFRYLQQRFGPAENLASLSNLNEIYMPTVEEEQTYTFKISRHIKVALTYQHQFRPWREAAENKDKWGASFTAESLRPDITLTLYKTHQPPVIMVIDAKSTDYFRPIRFREMADYSRQVFDMRDGSQPIKQVFLLHRDRTFRSRQNLTNIPSYFGEETPKDTFILGAVPLLPEFEKKKREARLESEAHARENGSSPLEFKEEESLLGTIIDKFLLTYGNIPPNKE